MSLQVKDDIYETMAPKTPVIQGEIMVSKGSAGQKSCISNSDINHGLDANVSPSIMNPLCQAKTLGHSQDHIMVERKRSERLSQRFIALLDLIPGLKKVILLRCTSNNFLFEI